MSILIIIVGAVANPFALFFASQNVFLFWEIGNKVVEQVESTGYFHF